MGGLGAHLAGSAAAFRAVFRNPNLRRLSFALTGSAVGHWSYIVALLGVRLVQIDSAATAPERTRFGLLRAIPMFAALPGPTLERLASQLIPVEFDAGAEIIRQGEAGDRFYAIASGLVDVCSNGTYVATLYPGDYVGEIALLRGVPRVATVLARDPVEAFTLERDEFLAAVTGHAPSARAAEAIAGARLAGLQGSRVMGVRGV